MLQGSCKIMRLSELLLDSVLRKLNFDSTSIRVNVTLLPPTFGEFPHGCTSIVCRVSQPACSLSYTINGSTSYLGSL